MWRAPEGPEGTGGLRGAAPNEVRPPSLAGGRTLRRPEHPWGHKQPGPTGVEGAGGAWPGHSQRRPIGDRREACGAWPDHSQRRPVGGRREACGAWPGFETTRRAKLAARTASGRAGLAAAGDLAASRTKSGGPQENLGTTTHAFTDVN